MSRISDSLWILKQYKVMSKEELQDLENKMKLQAYKENNFEDLVNIHEYLDFETIDLGDLEYGYDYEILTGCHKTENGEYVSDEEEFQEIWDREFEYYKSEFEIEAVKNVVNNNGDKKIEYKITDCYGEVIGYSDIEEEAEEYINEKATDYTNELVGECFEDLEFEYDEIWCNFVGRFDEYDINIENAEAAGMGVVELRNGDTYLVLGGCGMDMSFQYMHYLILTYKHLTPRFANNSSIKWLRQMVGDERFIELMVMCGLDEELLRKYLKK